MTALLMSVAVGLLLLVLVLLWHWRSSHAERTIAVTGSM